jgi:hypothetical protein
MKYVNLSETEVSVTEAHISALPRAPKLRPLIAHARQRNPADKQFELSTRPGQSRIHYFRSAREFLCVQCGYWDNSDQWKA